MKDLAYAPAQPAHTEGHLLDLYVPRSDKPVPLVISTRGSAWLADNGRRDAEKVAAELNPAGYAVAGVSIRSSSQAQFPSQLYDIKGAIRWLRANAKAYNLDPERIGIMGDSSGGWTTAMAAVTSDDPALEGNVGVSGPSSAVQAAIPFYPPTDFLQMDAHMPDNCEEFNAIMGITGCHSDPRSPESRLLGCTITECPPAKVAAANPLTYVGKRPIPPTLIFHGEPDALVPYHQGRLLYDKLAATGHDARMISFPKAAHGTLFDMLTDDATREGAYEEAARDGRSTPSRPVSPTWNTVISFLNQHLR
ncbi:MULTISPECIES: alpha/beta hydrolase [unclassified Streptomyces]|uniref:alpha/beta hydrolase n=1 Tax=unclassified Streptomyces TaxID=2593676 RepID=UPI0023659C3A|nr:MULTISPECIES: alpha/beta hydrolase [unclassified Streptomyces]MDF3145649.1 alpha/beta hydrolase [Streptomyces sp. T21Q-yed]WDF41972.1 alpha/beta hydrolase [Streptomyces sp. T12]